MTIPAVMFIEMALDELSGLQIREAELKEFRMLGAARIAQLDWMHSLTDMEKGYLLGIYTARIILDLNPDAIKAKISL